MTFEVEDSPNRCPQCQRVQLHARLCQACEHFYQTDNDILDLLDTMVFLVPLYPSEIRDRALRMITSMREAIKRRNPYVTSAERVCEGHCETNTVGPKAREPDSGT